MVWFLVAWVVACGEAEPQKMEDCVRVKDATERETCRFEFAQTLIKDKPALEKSLQSIEDVASADLLRLRLAVHHPMASGWLCAGVKTDVARRKCDQVLGRPHLSGGPR